MTLTCTVHQSMLRKVSGRKFNTELKWLSDAMKFKLIFVFFSLLDCFKFVCIFP